MMANKQRMRDQRTKWISLPLEGKKISSVPRSLACLVACLVACLLACFLPSYLPFQFLISVFFPSFLPQHFLYLSLSFFFPPFFLSSFIPDSFIPDSFSRFSFLSFFPPYIFFISFFLLLLLSCSSPRVNLCWLSTFCVSIFCLSSSC